MLSSNLVIIVLLLSGSVAFAQTGFKGFNVTFGYGFGENANSGDSYDPKRMSNLQFISLGTTHEEGMYIGIRYENQNLNYAGSTGKQSALGASLGFGESGAYITAHYFLNISRELEDGRIKGDGSGIDFGYQFPFFYQNFLTTGLQYSLRYTKYDDTKKNRTTQGMPMVVFGINF